MGGIVPLNIKVLGQGYDFVPENKVLCLRMTFSAKGSLPTQGPEFMPKDKFFYVRVHCSVSALWIKFPAKEQRFVPEIRVYPKGQLSSLYTTVLLKHPILCLRIKFSA